MISNPGNTTGIDPLKENSPEYVKDALNQGFHVVVDVWLVGRQHFCYGIRKPSFFPITVEFLKSNKIICHAKTVETLERLMLERVHCFIHDRDDYVLTNGGIIWTSPGKPITTRSVFTMPEHFIPDISSLALLTCAGVCSNRIQEIKNKREELDM